jgi:hypothetical protein
MQSENVFKHIAIAFVIAVVLYIVSFGWIEHRRTFRGPWEITFTSDAAGQPSLAIAQSTLGISERITFTGHKIAATNLAQVERFEVAVSNLPFGEMIFQDPTFLPGTVTMRQFGHEIELLPRTLIVDSNEVPWRAGQTVDVR